MNSSKSSLAENEMDVFIPPHPDSVVYPQVTVFVPYAKMQLATLVSLIGFNYTPVQTLGEFGYSEFFKQRWIAGKTFINIEQDIVAWPGAIKAIWDCPEPWCVYDFHLPCHWTRNLENEKVGVPIGCVKISAEAISKTLGIWEEPVEWVMCEQNITKALVKTGITAHQHHPGVVNANPVLIGVH